MNSHIVINQMRKKLVEKSVLTEDDLTKMAAAARILGSVEARVTYAAVKQQLNNQSNEETEESAN
ncbi:hypothetical protein [Bacillus sp. AFS017336]|uniref:hypothetical protein n=1 Tax=Bacillus sp. AFS017336 TaxID=2033489 RepID=UPI000BF1CF8A|nr:hypothetical protein [Bacillus sp. AFS017336]PEL06742.1 hypothetical protein CN601_20665 [Bacillus sp. AFS017336]